MDCLTRLSRSIIFFLLNVYLCFSTLFIKIKKVALYVIKLEPSIWAEPVGPARFCLSPVGPGLGFRGKNRGVGPEGPALKG